MSDTLQNDEALGLSIDMLDADRLGQWAANIQTYGSNISEWGDRRFVVNELQRLSGAIKTAVQDIGVLRAQQQEIASLRARLDAAEQERDLLKAGILAELHGGNSLPDFWTAERQLPYVAKALENARRWHPLETCPRDRDVAFYWRDGNTVVGRFDDWCNDDMPDGWASIPPLPPKE